ncbi:CFI-box-CTERM domain-containing protein [Acidobacteriota bacterium]
MKGRIIAIICLLHLTSFLTLNAQWVRTYGGSQDDYPRSMLLTNDGGYIVAGISESFGQRFRKIWVLKINSSEGIEWQKTYDVDDAGYAYSIQQTSDGGYILGGNVRLPRVGDFILVIKISSFGDIEWKHYYQDPTHVHISDPTPGGGGEPTTYQGAEVSSIQQTDDGGYIAVCNAWLGPGGNSEKDIWILKLSWFGDIEWNKIYGESAVDDQAFSVQQANDGGYIVVGHTESYGAGDSDILILKLASNGTIEWQKTYGGSSSENAYSIQKTYDGGYIVAGQSASFGAGSLDIWILKLSSEGIIEWNKTYGGSNSETAHSIQKTIDGGYVVTGSTHSFGAGMGDIWILKLNILGAIEWQKTYKVSQYEEVSFIQQTNDGGYIVASSTDTYGAGERDFLIVKLSSNGDTNSSCGFVSDSNAEVLDTDITPADSYLDAEDFNIFSEDIEIVPQESEAIVYSLCSGQHTLNITTSFWGTTVPQPGIHIYDHAERININTVPDEGYTFIGWSGDVISIDEMLSIIMDSDKSVKANFGENIIEKLFEDAKKAPCFIATAAFGSPLHPYVQTLQDFRDKYLMTSRAGRKLVNLYYKYSPYIAELIANHKALKTVVRFWLVPFVAMGYSMVQFGPIKTSMMLLLSIMPLFFFVWFYRRRNKQD